MKKQADEALSGTDAPGDEMIQASQPMTYLCERCGRAVGQEIIACPDQPQGHCPFVKRNLVPLKSRLVSVGFLLIGILSLLLGRLYDYDFVPDALIGLGLFGMGFFGTFQTSTLLYHPNSRLRWKRKAFLGITLERRLIPSGWSPRLELSLPQPLLFPPSVTKLSEIALNWKGWGFAQATDLFRTALVGLLARGVVQIQQYQEYIARGWGEFKRGQDLYVFTAAEEGDSASINGALEQRILSVLSSWTTRKGEETLEWPDGPLVHQLVRAVYDKDVYSPEYWVFDLVAQDAVAHGWGRLKRWPRKRFVPDSAHEDRLRSEQVIVNGLCSRFVQQQPALSKVLTDQIKEAVLSRTIQQTVDY